MKSRDHIQKEQTGKVKPGLYLVATPIGNMGDITLRAIETLRAVDVIACEDTRVSGNLLRAFDIKKPLIPLHDHNELQDSGNIIRRIEGGEAVALISDAGMPLISDPGYKLVQECRKAGVYITSLPGANSPLMALQLSGLPSDRFTFAGFLPNKSTARREVLASYASRPETLIFFDSPNRVEDTLEDILHTLGDRQIALTRELTKMFEDIRSGSVLDVIKMQREDPARGEIVLVIEGRRNDAEDIDLESLLRDALKNNSVKDAVTLVAGKTGISKKQVYDAALSLQTTMQPDDDGE